MNSTIKTVPKSQIASAQDLEQFSDADLLDAWDRDRLADAFAVLVRRHGAMVWSVCRRKCLSAADADDAYQSTFLVLARNSGKIRRPECLAGWLHRVAQRASAATLHAKTCSTDSLPEAEMVDDPLDRISQQHDAIVLDEELAALPEHYRAALVMHVYEGRQLKQLAEHFETTLGAVRGRLQRGKRLLANRLRLRGVVPVLAVAAAGRSVAESGSATAAEAAANATLLQSIETGVPPSPPIAENLLSPLFDSGKRIMTPWTIASGLAAAGALTAMLISPPGSGGAEEQADVVAVGPPMTLRANTSPIAAQLSSVPVTEPSDGQPPAGGAASDPSSAGANPNGFPSGQPGTGDFQPGTGNYQPGTGTIQLGAGNNQLGPGGETRTVIQHRYRPAEATGPLAESITERLDQPIELRIEGALAELVDQLESQLDVPVILPPRVIEYAELEPATPLHYETRSEPLRSSLRKILQPLGLKATVETEALVITADHSALTRRGIGTSRWLNRDNDFMDRVAETLTAEISITSIQEPLREFAVQIGQQLDLPLSLDRRALQEIGLDADATVSADYGKLPAYDVISLALYDLDLVLSVKNRVVILTTLEAAEDELLSRIYWLEGLGINGDYDGLMTLIETTINCDLWESLGGNSTMGPTPGSRPGLVVNTTYDTHREIEQLIQTLRENSFRRDGVVEEIEVPAPLHPQPFFGGGGFGGGGMGGGGGGGGGFF